MANEPASPSNMMPSMHPKFINTLKQDNMRQSSQTLSYKKRFLESSSPSQLIRKHVFKKTKSKGEIITPKPSLIMDLKNFQEPEYSLENYSQNSFDELKNFDSYSQSTLKHCSSEITVKDAPITIQCQSEDLSESEEESEEGNTQPLRRQNVRTFNSFTTTTTSSAFTFKNFTESKNMSSKCLFETFGNLEIINQDQN